MIPQHQARATESELQMQMMFLNQAADASFFAGQRPSNFFSSLNRQFVMQSATVLDHWKGFGDLSPEVSPEEFLEIVGDRNVTMPDGRITANTAQRIAARFDREQAEAAFESNFGSAVGGFVGGTAPWIFSPEGFAGILVPPLRLSTVGRAVISRVGATNVTVSPAPIKYIRQAATAQVPASIAVGGTNLLAQQAAYGEINALEASLAFGAPVLFGGGIGAFRKLRANRAAAATRGANESVDSPPVPRNQTTSEPTVPPRLLDAFVEWAGVTPTDNTATTFQKVLQKMQTDNIPFELVNPLVEAFARTGASASMRSVNPEIRRAVQRLMDAESRPVRIEAPDARARVQALDEQVSQGNRNLRETNKKIADLSRKERSNTAGAPTKSATAKVSPQMRKLLETRDRQWQEVSTLQRERSAIKLDPDNAVPMQQHLVETEQALQDLADVLARQTDHPLPAEFVAEFLEVAALTSRVSPDAINPPKLRAETDSGFDATTVTSDVVRYELDVDPAFRALSLEEGFSDAVDAFARVNRIIDECKV
jgi:hypothetical protein